MIKLLKAYYALKVLISVRRKLNQHGWKRFRKLGKYLSYKDYYVYSINVGSRVFFANLPKNIFSETFDDEFEECLFEIYKAMVYKNIREDIINGFIEHSEKNSFFDTMFKKWMDKHPFNLEDFGLKKRVSRNAKNKRNDNNDY